MRKRLAVTQREIVIDKDKSRCHRELLRQSRVYPFDVYCPNCSKAMKYEDEIIFHKKDKLDKFSEEFIKDKVTELFVILNILKPDSSDVYNAETFIRSLLGDA